MRVLAIASQKGGTAKTTTCTNVGHGLAARGRRVLWVDMDPQECLGAALGAPAPAEGLSLAEVLLEDAELEDVLLEVQGGTLAPAGVDLAEVELKLMAEPGGVLTLREALGPVGRRYDICVVDTPPSLGILTLAALAAANEVLIPLQTEFLALRRLGAMLRTVAKVRRRLNKTLRVVGVLPTMADTRTLHAREVLAELGRAPELAGVRVFEPIPRSVRFADGAAGGEPIYTSAPGSDGAAAYRALVEALDTGGR